MKRRILTVVAIAAVAGLPATVIWGRTPAPRARSRPRPSTATEFLIAAAGRVEPSSENIQLAAELNGKLKTMLVEEGDPVQRGQVLAELENSDYRAQVASAAAEVRQKAGRACARSSTALARRSGGRRSPRWRKRGP